MCRREERDHLQLYNRAVGITYSSTTARHFDSLGREFRINSEQNGVRHVTDLVLHRHRRCRFQSLSEGQCRGVSKECLSVRYTSATHETTQHLNISTSQRTIKHAHPHPPAHPHIPHTRTHTHTRFEKRSELTLEIDYNIKTGSAVVWGYLGRKADLFFSRS